MRILWVCNIIIPRIAKELNAEIRNIGGWLTGICDSLINDEEISLSICFPFVKNIRGEVDSISYFGFQQGSTKEMLEIINASSPDVIHIWGTEFSHSRHMLEAANILNLLDNTIVSIQGLISVYARHFYSGLPFSVTQRFTIRDFIKMDNIALQRRSFMKRGIDEINALKLSRNFIGRTDWDRACTQRINPEANYYVCNESLRSTFYINAGKWEPNKCNRHTIFVSQSHYPIKGFHIMLEAMIDIVKEYPDAKLFTTGINPMINGLKPMIHKTYYNKYISKLIKKYQLQDHVFFLGSLDEKAMCEQFLKANVFVSCSSIENSSNSVGEAMLVGTPIVSSDVGGIHNLLQFQKEGFLYPFNEPYMCAYYINKIFSDDELAMRLSKNANLHACKTHDLVANKNELMKIYREISRC